MAKPLHQIEVSVLELKVPVNTAADGSFVLSNLPNRKITLRVSAVGYRLVQGPVELTAEQSNKEVSVTLAPDNFPTETAEAKRDLYQLEGAAVPGQLTLNAAGLRESSTVLANDPLRSWFCISR